MKPEPPGGPAARLDFLEVRALLRFRNSRESGVRELAVSRDEDVPKAKRNSPKAATTVRGSIPDPPRVGLAALCRVG